MKKSPSARSLELLRNHNWIAQNVEHYNPWAKRRNDLFNFIDIVAMSPKEHAIMGVQVTTASNMSERIKKMTGLASTRFWLDSGGLIQLHGWRKLKRDSQGWLPFIWEMTVKDKGHFLLTDVSYQYI